MPDEGGSTVRQRVSFPQLQALARKKNAAVLAAMFHHRDDVITHPDGREFAAVKALGKVEQPFMPKLAESLAEAVAHDDETKAEVDREVLAIAHDSDREQEDRTLVQGQVVR